jgi:hypothetical protein
MSGACTPPDIRKPPHYDPRVRLARKSSIRAANHISDIIFGSPAAIRARQG